MRIDAHQHFWKIGRYDYPWMGPQAGVLGRDYGPGELGPLLETRGIDRSVLVQTISSLDETRWFLDLAREHSFIGGVVGWVDLTSPAAGETLDEIRGDPALVGIRHQVHDESDTCWLLRDDVRRGLGELEKRSLPYDLLIRPQHLEASAQTAKRFPALPLVVDHIAKPAIARRQFDDWAAGILDLAACPNVYCKLSGMITEADPANWKPADLKPYVDHLVEAFSPGRCMFGSDWPVCLRAGSYAQVVEALAENIEPLSSAERDDVFGNTAARFYGLEDSE